MEESNIRNNATDLVRAGRKLMGGVQDRRPSSGAPFFAPLRQAAFFIYIYICSYFHSHTLVEGHQLIAHSPLLLPESFLQKYRKDKEETGRRTEMVPRTPMRPL